MYLIIRCFPYIRDIWLTYFYFIFLKFNGWKTMILRLHFVFLLSCSFWKNRWKQEWSLFYIHTGAFFSLCKTGYISFLLKTFVNNLIELIIFKDRIFNLYLSSKFFILRNNPKQYGSKKVFSAQAFQTISKILFQ